VTTVDVLDLDGARSGTLELPADVFDVQANIPLMHQVVVAQLAAARQGTHKTKTRGEVSGGGKKPYKQKGTGRARQGSTRAPQFAGGGVVHGPVPRDYTQRTPKKMKAAALRGALSDRARDGQVHVVEGFVGDDTPSTKAAMAALATVTEATKVLVVLDSTDETNWLSLRNVPTVHLLEAGQLNTYDVVNSPAVVFTTKALEEFLGRPLDVTAAKADKPAKKAAKATKAATKPAEADDADVDDAEETEAPAAKPAKKATKAAKAKADEEADK
jgi:large subunit ribosomal protein L4